MRPRVEHEGLILAGRHSMTVREFSEGEGFFYLKVRNVVKERLEHECLSWTEISPRWSDRRVS